MPVSWPGNSKRSAPRQPRLHAVRKRIAAVPGARLDDLPWQRAADDLLDAPRRLDQRIEVDPRLDAHGVQAVHEVLGTHVSRGAGSPPTRAGTAAPRLRRGSRRSMRCPTPLEPWPVAPPRPPRAA